MRFAFLAVLVLGTGCGRETAGTPAAEPPRVATTPGAATPAGGPAAPLAPQPEPAAGPVTTASASAVREAPAAETASPAARPATPAPAAEPEAPAPPQPQPAAAPAPSASSSASSEAHASDPAASATQTATTAPAAEPVAAAEPRPTATASAAPRAAAPTPPATSALVPTVPDTTAVPPAAVAEMDLKALEDQLRQTKAIGFMTKLTLKGQVDDLLDRFRDYYRGKTTLTMKDLRRSYDLLMMKVLSLLQDADQQLASAIVASREAIWGLLADPVKFETLQG